VLNDLNLTFSSGSRIYIRMNSRSKSYRTPLIQVKKTNGSITFDALDWVFGCSLGSWFGFDLVVKTGLIKKVEAVTVISPFFVLSLQNSPDQFITVARNLNKVKGGKELPDQPCGTMTVSINFKHNAQNTVNN